MGLDKRREILRRIEELAEPDYARFAKKLLRKPGEESAGGSAAGMMGVRLPALRRLARELAKEDWQESMDALAEAERFEEIMLRGFLIGLARFPEPEAYFELIRDFLPRIDNWSLCDSFCAGLTFARRFPERTWEFLQPLLHSDEEYEARFALVMLLDHFVEEKYINRLFHAFSSVSHKGYYVQMANAWAISVCYVRFPEKTGRWLETENGLDSFTFRKALQKIGESRRISERDREWLAKMRTGGKDGQ